VLEDANTVAMRARAAVLAGYAADADAVLAARRDTDPSVRAYAIVAAARLRRRTVAERVEDLTDEAAEVRRRACEIEARSPRPGAKVTAALEACLADPDPLVAVAAADALGEARATSSVGALASTAETHGDARCREAAIAALGAIGDPAGLEAVLVALADKPAVRRRAVVALSAFAGDEVEAALARALTDRDWQVREVARALLDVDDDVENEIDDGLAT
jgi:HEAT repeat protein